jgi:hypothetical protein
MLDWLKVHAVALGVFSVMPIILWAAKKFLPTLARKYTDIFLKAMCNPDITDPYIKEQVVVITKAAMRIAEHTMQEKAGQERMTWVVDYVCAKTSLKREDVVAIAQGIYDGIKAELKEHGAEIVVVVAPPAGQP